MTNTYYFHNHPITGNSAYNAAHSSNDKELKIGDEVFVCAEGFNDDDIWIIVGVRFNEVRLGYQQVAAPPKNNGYHLLKWNPVRTIKCGWVNRSVVTKNG